MRLIAILILILFQANIYCQKVIRAAIVKDKNITLYISLIDKVYKLSDTVNIDLRIENNSNINIYVFNPASNIQPIGFDSSNCQYTLEFGGNYNYRLGFTNYTNFIKTLPKSKKTYKIPIILKDKYACNCNFGVNDAWRDPPNTFSFSIVLNVGYYVNNGNIKFIYKDKFLDFNSDEDGLNFESKLKRVFLGPLWIRFTK